MKWSIPEKIVARGREYAKAGRVVSIEPDFEKMVWHVEVLGSQMYQVILDGTAKEADVCTCPYWQEKGYCKHTVAAELALREKGYSRILNKNEGLLERAQNTHKKSDMAKVLTERFANLQQQKLKQGEAEKRPLRVDVLLETIDTTPFQPEKALIGISLKIGYKGKGNRSYVVKNIGEFLTAYDKQTWYETNSQHSFFLERGCFHRDIQKILNKILGFYHTSQISGGMQAPKKNQARHLVLPPDGASDFARMLIEAQMFELKNQDVTYQNVTLRDEGLLPITFNVRGASGGYVLVVTSEIVMYWEAYQWILTPRFMQHMTSQQKEVYSMLQQILKRMRRPEVYYGLDEVGDLFTYVLPMLKQIGDVQIERELQSDMVQEPLKTTIYLRKSWHMIKARVDFCYGDVVFSTDSRFEKKQDKSQFVIRNLNQEREVLRLLDQFKFRIERNRYVRELPQGSELYHFFNAEIPRLKEYGEVVLEERLSALYLDAAKYKPSVTVTEDDSWLDIHFDITGIEEEEIDDLLTHLLNQEDYYQLKDGALLPLDTAEFHETSEALIKIRQLLRRQNGKLQISRYNGVQLEEAFGQKDNVSYSADFKQMVYDLTHPELFPAQLPKGLHASLRNYQETGFKWLKMLSEYSFGGILADEMGLGKTLQMITYLLSDREMTPDAPPALIVAPASLIYNWQMEVQRFAPMLQTVVVAGTKKERLTLLEKQKADILITSYAGVRQDEETYEQMDLSVLVIDEAQMVKNSATKTAKAVKNISAPQRFALSGTPIENNLEELWTLFQLIMPGFLPSRKKFNQLSAAEVARIIQPFILRREKREVLKDLPDKLESNLYSTLSVEQKTMYLAYLKQMQEEVAGMDNQSFRKNRIGILAGLTRLRQICCDPKLFDSTYEGTSGKLEQVKELILKAKANHRRILLFSQFTSMLSIIEEALHQLNLSTFYLRGSTKPKDRMKMVDAFNQGAGDVFLISLKAGGTGLNLTGADTVILYDLWWNPAVEEQAAGRAHRIGQKKVVEVFRLIAEGTIEEKIDRLQQEKKELFQKVMTADEERKLTALTEDDIRQILSIGQEV